MSKFIASASVGAYVHECGPRLPYCNIEVISQDKQVITCKECLAQAAVTFDKGRMIITPIVINTMMMHGMITN